MKVTTYVSPDFLIGRIERRIADAELTKDAFQSELAELNDRIIFSQGGRSAENINADIGVVNELIRQFEADIFTLQATQGYGSGEGDAVEVSFEV